VRECDLLLSATNLSSIFLRKENGDKISEIVGGILLEKRRAIKNNYIYLK
jgi:hypothetical protein